MGEGIVESEMEELVPEWVWQSDKGSWLQRQGEAERNEWLDVLREDDEGIH